MIIAVQLSAVLSVIWVTASMTPHHSMRRTSAWWFRAGLTLLARQPTSSCSRRAWGGVHRVAIEGLSFPNLRVFKQSFPDTGEDVRSWVLAGTTR
jgi:hypothetical protein